ncbi:MAG: methyltransferase [Bacteroidota bacterium]
METTIEKQVTPSHIMQVGMGFWASKTLLTAVKLGLFTELANGGMTAASIQDRLGLHRRGLYDFLDSLVALGFLQREGLKEQAIYFNAEDTDKFLDRNKPSYMGGVLEMSDRRLYAFWDDLEEGLKTGLPQNEEKHHGKSIFEELYADREKLKGFTRAMTGIQIGNFMAFAKKFDFSEYHTLCDVGGAGADLSAHVVMNNPHMECTSFDLPPVQPVAAENIDHLGLADKVKAVAGDFFKDELPKADIITMGNVMHDWSVEDKLILMKKAFDALPEGGSLVVIESIIDDDRRQNVFGLLMSLNMLIETKEGFDFTGRDFDSWAKEVGFSETYIMPLTGPSSAAVAIK